MSKPRKVSVLKTEYFDILYSSPSENTAKYLADNLDNLYIRAKNRLPDAHDLHIPVIISPDSDGLSVEYTSAPYNRIVCFDGVAEKDSFFQDSLLGLFYHEIYLALSQSIRSPINQFIYKTIGGDSYQPISLIYLPFTFVQGRAFVEDGSLGGLAAGEVGPLAAAGTGNDPPGGGKIPAGIRTSDKSFLEILSIAKYEDKFPNWLQASVSKDIYPGPKLTEAAGAAFAAYLMQTYGIDKYVEFWNTCGNMNFNLTAGLFKKVYGIPLDTLWQGFEDSVPLPSPEQLEKMKALEKETEKIFPSDRESYFQNLLVTEYGIVWYDSIRHEVDILDWNNPLKMRTLLFMATDVQKMSLSQNGRYLVVSFYGKKIREQFRDDKVWIYDLQQREFLHVKFSGRDGELISPMEKTRETQQLAVIDVKDKISKINIYNFKPQEKHFRLKDEISFPQNKNPYCLTYGGQNNILFLITENNISTMYKLNLENMSFQQWQFSYRGKKINIENMTNLPQGKLNKNSKNHYFTFQFYPENGFFPRTGFIKLNENFQPEKVYFQDMDLAGGAAYPFIANNNLYFVSNRLDHSDLSVLPLEKITWYEGIVLGDQADGQRQPAEPAAFLEAALPSQAELPQATAPAVPAAAQPTELPAAPTVPAVPEAQPPHQLLKYNPFKYIMKFSISPFMTIKDLTATEEQKLWPGLGATITTQDDPFMNNKIMISAAGAYAPLDFITTVNPTEEELYEYEKLHVDDKKNISAGIIIENTSTPVDIKTGCLFKANLDGQYNFTTILNGLWQQPLGMSFSRLIISLNTFYTASTDYYDVSLKENFPGKSNWPSFRNAYESSKLTLAVEYSNIHQYGVSKYENIGFSAGLYLDSFWDITEIRMLKKKYGKDNVHFPFTEAQRKKLFAENLLEMSQLNIGFFTDIKIPKLTPLSMYKGLVLSMPSTVKADFLVEPGTALHVNTETLLLGWECQNGIPAIYTYISRLGLKAGYDLRLKYNTAKVPLPDIRVKETWWNVFSDAYVSDSVFLVYDMDFCLAIGRLSKYNMNLKFKSEYFIHTKGFAFTFNFKVSL